MAKSASDRISDLERENGKLRERLRDLEDTLGTFAARLEGFGIVLDELADYLIADEQEKRRMEEARDGQKAEHASIDAAKKRGAQTWRQRARGLGADASGHQKRPRGVSP